MGAQVPDRVPWFGWQEPEGSLPPALLLLPLRLLHRFLQALFSLSLNSP